jgi:hypothetical protein
MKPATEIKSVILLLDQSFGLLRLVQDKDSCTAIGADPTPSTIAVLEQFEKLNVQVNVVVPEFLTAESLPRLKAFLPSVDEIVMSDRDLLKTLSDCQVKGLVKAPEQTLFVASDRLLRGQAVSQGYLAVPHPAIAALMVCGRDLQFARITGNREQLNRLPEIIPYFWEKDEQSCGHLLAVLSRNAIAQAIARQLRVEVLPLNIATEDPLLVQLDAIDRQVTEALSQQRILFADNKQVLVSLDSTVFNDSLPLQGAHGYCQFLAPCPELLKPPRDATNMFRQTRLALGRLPLEKLNIAPIPRELTIPEMILAIPPATAASFQADVARYSGAADLDSSGPIVSRHIRHPDNARVVQALLRDLNDMGYCAYTHSFSHAGMTLNNVIADLPGTGYFLIDPELLKLIREILLKILLKFPLPDPPPILLRSLMQLLGDEWLEEHKLLTLSPRQLRVRLEEIFELKPYFPWWLKFCPLPGPGAKIVIVGGHLDSTASGEAGYNPLSDPAPGADDNASGIAATLAIARYLSKLPRPRHTVRFCFFNAEEAGLVGSKAYAAMLKAANAPVKAVVCTDMMGYNSDAARIFEVHAGYTDSAIRDASVPIAESIAAWAASLGTLQPAQIYRGTIMGSGSDRNKYDGAINRSDHAAFHQQGYSAVVVSEDYFANLPTEPSKDPNPNYHRFGDVTIDSAFGADITCAIAYAVRELAGG